MKMNDEKMKSDKRRPRVLISGGGTGGHIFPALSIANILRDKLDAEILFVGADNRMEMERVPAAGYRITGLPVAGFDRRHLMRNFSVLLKLRKSIALARKIVKDFRPDIAIGVGGYASGPTLKAAQRAGVPTLLQEQNSYPGVTNKLLAKNALTWPNITTRWEMWMPELVLFPVFAALLWRSWKKHRSMLTLYAFVYFILNYCLSWLLSAGRYLSCALPYFLFAAEPGKALSFTWIVIALPAGGKAPALAPGSPPLSSPPLSSAVLR